MRAPVLSVSMSPINRLVTSLCCACTHVRCLWCAYFCPSFPSFLNVCMFPCRYQRVHISRSASHTCLTRFVSNLNQFLWSVKYFGDALNMQIKCTTRCGCEHSNRAPQAPMFEPKIKGDSGCVPHYRLCELFHCARWSRKHSNRHVNYDHLNLSIPLRIGLERQTNNKTVFILSAQSWPSRSAWA